jgi:hypothetical protein
LPFSRPSTVARKVAVSRPIWNAVSGLMPPEVRNSLALRDRRWVSIIRRPSAASSRGLPPLAVRWARISSVSASISGDRMSSCFRLLSKPTSSAFILRMLAAAASDTFHLALTLASWRAVSPEAAGISLPLKAPPLASSSRSRPRATRLSCSWEKASGLPCIAFGAALPTRCECITASLAIWVWLDATAPLPALRHSEKMVTRMPAAKATSRMRSWRGSDRWPISGRRRSSSAPVDGGCRGGGALLAAGQVAEPQAASSAEWYGAAVARCSARLGSGGGARIRHQADAELGVGRGQHGGALSLSLGENSNLRIPFQLQSRPVVVMCVLEADRPAGSARPAPAPPAPAASRSWPSASTRRPSCGLMSAAWRSPCTRAARKPQGMPRLGAKVTSRMPPGGRLGYAFLRAEEARQVDHADQAAANVRQAQVPGLGQRHAGERRHRHDLAGFEQVEQVALAADLDAQLVRARAAAGARGLHALEQLFLVLAQAGAPGSRIEGGHGQSPSVAILASSAAGSTGLTK